MIHTLHLVHNDKPLLDIVLDSLTSKLDKAIALGKNSYADAIAFLVAYSTRINAGRHFFCGHCASMQPRA